MKKPNLKPNHFDLRWSKAKLVNEGKNTTATSAQVDLHYSQLGIQNIWDADRVLRLCGWLRITQYELASLIMFPHTQMKFCLKRNYFPGSVCLLFSLIENQVMRDKINNPVPENDDERLMPFDKVVDHG